MHWSPSACWLPRAKPGNNNAAKMAMQAITTTNSITVNAAGSEPTTPTGFLFIFTGETNVVFIISSKRNNPVKPMRHGG
jgi:hypothetical protein